MVASDSIRHADIVSQIVSWLENGRETAEEAPDRGLLTEILADGGQRQRILLTKNHASRSQGGKTSLGVDRYGRGET